MLPVLLFLLDFDVLTRLAFHLWKNFVAISFVFSLYFCSFLFIWGKKIIMPWWNLKLIRLGMQYPTQEWCGTQSQVWCGTHSQRWYGDTQLHMWCTCDAHVIVVSFICDFQRKLRQRLGLAQILTQCTDLLVYMLTCVQTYSYTDLMYRLFYVQTYLCTDFMLLEIIP